MSPSPMQTKGNTFSSLVSPKLSDYASGSQGLHMLCSFIVHHLHLTDLGTIGQQG